MPALHLRKRGAVWHYSRTVPPDVAPIIGKRFWRFTLDTHCQRSAEAARSEWDVEHQKIIDDIRGMSDLQKLAFARSAPRLPRQQASDASLKRFLCRRPVVQPDFERGGFTVDDDIGDDPTFKQIEAGALSSAEASMFKLNSDEAELVAEAGGVSAFYREVQRSMMTEEYQSIVSKMLKQNREARFTAEVRSRVLQEKIGVCEKLGLNHFGEPAPNEPGLLETLESWLSKAQRARSTKVKYRLHVRRLAEFVGDVPVTGLTSAQIKEFVAHYAAIPNTRLLPLSKRTLTMRQLLALKTMNPQLEVVGVAQASKMLDYLRAFLKHVGRADLLPDAIRPNERTAHAATKRRDRAFEPDDLSRILDEVEQRYGPHDDLTWWCWLLAYSGMRPTEAAQLARGNIRQIRQIWAIEINDLENRSVKNAQSVRTLPVHPKLLDRGLITFVSSDTSPRLFASFIEDDKGDVANNPSRRLKRVIQALNIEGAGSAGRFRHSFIDALRNAGLPYSIELGLVGHADDNKHHAGYGRGASLKAMAREICKVDPCID